MCNIFIRLLRLRYVDSSHAPPPLLRRRPNITAREHGWVCDLICKFITSTLALCFVGTGYQVSVRTEVCYLNGFRVRVLFLMRVSESASVVSVLYYKTFKEMNKSLRQLIEINFYCQLAA